MEPSLRSSHARAAECKLSRPDPALHETTQRFVESLSKDIRISQYADPAFAAKRVAEGQWQWLEPSGRPGYLVFLPKQPILWLDDQFKRAFKIPMRVASALYEKKSVFIASLNLSDRTLRIEDCWMHCGTLLRGQAFSKRWKIVNDLFCTDFRPDSYLQRGLEICPAVYRPLADALEWSNQVALPDMMFVQSESAPRRLRVHMGGGGNNRPVPSPSNTSPTPSVKTKPLHHRAGQMYATPHPEYPDTYNLTMDSESKGYAAVQDLALSKKLRASTASCGAEGFPVTVEWNDEFKMFEILSTVG